MKTEPFAIGMDVGGSHVSCAAVCLADGCLLESSRSRVTISHTEAASDILAAWAGAINDCLAGAGEDGCAGLGIAIPGPFDYTAGVSLMQHKFADLEGLDISLALRPLLQMDANLPICYVNDAAAFGIGEAWQGQGRDEQRLLAITLGTGLGAAFMDRGIHQPRELWDQPWKEGIADDYFTTRWFTRSYLEQTGETVEGAFELAERARAGQQTSVNLFEQFGAGLGQFLTPWLADFECRFLLLGGNINGAYDLFGDALKSSL